jgi:hypothetical protein
MLSVDLWTVPRPEIVVGWYHSHPGFGCWLSGTDVGTQKVRHCFRFVCEFLVPPCLHTPPQRNDCWLCCVIQSFEQLHARAVAVVVDPIQSVKGKVVIDAFRTINPQLMMMGQEPRQTTSNLGHLVKPSIQALVHGLNRHYYSMCISYRKNEAEEKMLMNLHKKKWSHGLKLASFGGVGSANETSMKVGCFVCFTTQVEAPAEPARPQLCCVSPAQRMVSLLEGYKTRIDDEETKTAEEMVVSGVGKVCVWFHSRLPRAFPTHCVVGVALVWRSG